MSDFTKSSDSPTADRSSQGFFMAASPPHREFSEPTQTRSDKTNPHYVIKFGKVTDIPPLEFRSKINAYLRAHIAIPKEELDTSSNRIIKVLHAITERVTTPVRLDCNEATWCCFRDFRINPPADAVLCVELLHNNFDQNKPNPLVGKVRVAISMLENPEGNYLFTNYKVR